jgi:hypothetical protein
VTDITDPAWFYSSLAQVSASIFGIIGAVFATRLSDYTQGAIAAHDQVQRAISTVYIDLLNHAEAMTNPKNYDGATTTRDIEILNRAAALFKGLRGRVTNRGLQKLIDTLKANQEGATAPFATGYLDQHVPWLERVHYQVKFFRRTAAARPLWAMWFLLAWLTGVGIIWPMMALPGLDGARFGKTYILALFSLGAVAFVIFRLLELIRLRISTRDLWWRR